MTARPPLEVVLATSNPGKLTEIDAILADLPIRLVPLSAFPHVTLPEEGSEYEPNALEKARAAARGCGQPALADDSGLEVEALDGAPGPHSARYGGNRLRDAERTARLLAALEGIPPARRGARFVCWAALAHPDGRTWTARGECRGSILTAPRGEGGFGYDPIFALEGGERSMAELPPQEKNRVSHRARAFRGLAAALRSLTPGRQTW